MSVRTAIVRRAIDLAALLAEVQDTTNGATVLFVGQVREVNDGREVTGIEYTAYGEMAERELASIAEDCARTFGISQEVARRARAYSGGQSCSSPSRSIRRRDSALIVYR